MSRPLLVILAAAFVLSSPCAAGADDARRRGGAAGERPGKVTIRPIPPSGQEIPFAVAELYFELNDTDGDLGIHGLIDGEPWAQLHIEDPDERVILGVLAAGSLRKQGLTELFFESAEPSFDELPPEKFFRRFPEGTYEIEGRSLEGDELEAEVELSHVLAAPPGNVTVQGQPAAENCDATLPVVNKDEPVVIDWDPVTGSHPEIGRPGLVEIARYQFFVEVGEAKLGVDLPPSITQFTVPPELLALGDEFKFEIIARTSTGNNTAVESCFLAE